MEKAERGSRLNMVLYYTHEERIHVASTFQPTAIQFIPLPLSVPNMLAVLLELTWEGL